MAVVISIPYKYTLMGAYKEHLRQADKKKKRSKKRHGKKVSKKDLNWSVD